MSTLSEKSLIDNCINGNRKSQRELYERFSQEMFAICLRYAQNQKEAEKILQDGFVKLFNNIYKFKGYESFETWVKRIFVKTAMEYAPHAKVQDYESDPVKNAIEIETSTTLENVYDCVYTRTHKNGSESTAAVFKLYAVERHSKNESTIGSTLTEAIQKGACETEESLTLIADKTNIKEEKKKINFSYTVQKNDVRRINKGGVLRVYNINEPVDIPVGRLLGKWKKEHVGITLIAVDDKWCIKGGLMDRPIHKVASNEPFSFNLFKSLGW